MTTTDSNIVPMRKPYPHIGRRVLNQPSGKMGTIAAATPRLNVKRGWDVTIHWDDGRACQYWSDREISKTGKQLNKLVPDDFVPDYGPRKERIEKLIARLDKGEIRWKRGYGTEAPVGLDSLHIWRPLTRFEVHADLYGGQGRWSAEGDTEDEAWANLRSRLVAILDSENDPAQAPKAAPKYL